VQRDTSPPSALFSFSLKRNIYKCMKPLLAAKACSDSRNELGTPLCNARWILLRREAQDESSARNSVSCQSLATLRRYGTLQRYKCVPTLKGQIVHKFVFRERCITWCGRTLPTMETELMLPCSNEIPS
jgi:hypothetical protein